MLLVVGWVAVGMVYGALSAGDSATGAPASTGGGDYSAPAEGGGMPWESCINGCVGPRHPIRAKRIETPRWHRPSRDFATPRRA